VKNAPMLMTSLPPPAWIVSLPAPEENLSASAPPVSTSLPRAGGDHELAVLLGRSIECDIVAGAQRAGLDLQRLAGCDRGIVGGEIVAVALRQGQQLDIDHCRGREHERIGAG